MSFVLPFVVFYFKVISFRNFCRCAGLIGAVPNGYCGVGVAPRSKIGGFLSLSKADN